MSYDRFWGFVLPLAKHVGAYDKVHQDWNEPTPDELAWLHFWDYKTQQNRLWALYEKAYGGPLVRVSPITRSNSPRRVG